MLCYLFYAISNVILFALIPLMSSFKKVIKISQPFKPFSVCLQQNIISFINMSDISHELPSWEESYSSEDYHGHGLVSRRGGGGGGGGRCGALTHSLLSCTYMMCSNSIVIYNNSMNVNIYFMYA